MWWNDYIGIDFKEKGRDRSGLDCWGLVCLVYREKLNTILPSYENAYATTNSLDQINTHIVGTRNLWDAVSAPHEFDVILLKIKQMPVHVGLVTKAGFMLHCERGVGVVHERYDGLKWGNRISGFCRYES